MASGEMSKLPNLKICIDNEESGSDSDRLSLTEDPEISIEDGEMDVRTVNLEEGEIPGSKTPVSEHDEENDVQFSVYLNKREPKEAEISLSRLSTRRYENKEGNFVTGVDFASQEQVGKLQERAKRFGIEYKPEPPVDLKELYTSLGIKAEDLNHKDERGIRLEAIHVRGLNEMNTKDVFNYFQEFAASGCEWIDDESCNVVWLDKVTAARAMLKLSHSYEQVMDDYGLKQGKSKTVTYKTETEQEASTGPDDKKDGVIKGEKEKEERTIEKMEEDDDDNFDLTEDRKEEEESVEEPEQKQDKPEKMEAEVIEEGEITDDESEVAVPVKLQNQFNKIPWPPGRWRLGVPHKNKAKYLFLRFATKADVKLPGAEQRSKYYQKYGNPNYGGMKGLLSKSMKRKMRNRMEQEDLETFGVPDTGPSIRNQISYGDDLFTDTFAPVEVQEIDIYSKPQTRKDKKSKKKALSEDEEETNIPPEESTFPVIEKEMTMENEGVTDSSDVDEEELERLLGNKEKKPVMRMYADEIEDKQKANRQRQMVGALTIVADAKKQVKKIRDARQLICGIDLRSALQESKMNRQSASENWLRSGSPEKWQKSRSPDTWKRPQSGSLSPNTERDTDGRLNFKRVSPMHMTIENDRVLESEQEDVSDREEEEEEIKELSPEPLKEMKQKKQVSTPLGTKSKMDLIEKPSDVHSRLSKRVIGDSRNIRRSPNNVRSRLSKRVSPENLSQDQDKRASRVRRSRSDDRFRSKYRMSGSRSPAFIRDRHLRGWKSRSPIRRRYERKRSPVRNRFPMRRRPSLRSRSPVRNRSPVRMFNRSRSRSPIYRQPARSNIRSHSPTNRRINDRMRAGKDARSRLGRKSGSPTDTEKSEDEDTEPSRLRMTVCARSSSESSSSSDSSSDESSSSSEEEGSSSSSSSSSSSDSSDTSSSSESDSSSNESESPEVQNKKPQRRMAGKSRSQERIIQATKKHVSVKNRRAGPPQRKNRQTIQDVDEDL